MFERLTEDSRKILALACTRASQLGHEAVGTGHLLLAIAEDKTTIAAEVLQTLGQDLFRIEKKIQAALGSPGPHAGKTGGLPFTTGAKQALELATAEANKDGGEQVDSDHLLIGLAAVGGDPGAILLAGFEVGLHDLRTRASRLRGKAPRHEGEKKTSAARTLLQGLDRQIPEAVWRVVEVLWTLEEERDKGKAAGRKDEAARLGERIDRLLQDIAGLASHYEDAS